MDALLIVDFQRDFCPGGALPVAGGDRLAPVLNALAVGFELVVATRDWHPPNHAFFERWPAHCVEATRGAELHPALRSELVDVVIDKGKDPNAPGYSAFEGTGLSLLLREHHVDHVVIAGLATEHCVRATALDALREGFAVTVVEDGIDAAAAAAARASLHESGATLACSAQLLAAR